MPPPPLTSPHTPRANFISYAPESILYFNGLSAEANGNVSPDALQMMPVTLAGLMVGLKLGGMAIKKVRRGW